MPSLPRPRRPRSTCTILLVLLALVLLGTLLVLGTVRSYFSIDQSAYILPQELLPTRDLVQSGQPRPLGPGLWSSWWHNHGPADVDVDVDADARAGTPVSSSSQAVNSVDAVKGALTHAGSLLDHGLEGPPSSLDDASPLTSLAANPAATWNASLHPPERIPRIIHQTWKDDVLPPRWKEVRDQCAAMHPDYEYMLWTDAKSRDFLAERYPWFLPVFDGYQYNIQRADAIRYFVLHHYGGVYMDLDVGCKRRLDPLLRFEVILPKTIPVGISNDVMLSAQGHPFMDLVIHNLVTFDHDFVMNYPTVMFSTGPMFLSAQYVIYVDAHGPATPSIPSHPYAGFNGVRVLPKSLYGKNAKPGEAPDAFFSHFYGSSWHADDAWFITFLGRHGRLLMLVAAAILAYGALRVIVPSALAYLAQYGFSRSRAARGGYLPLSTTPIVPSFAHAVHRHHRHSSSVTTAASEPPIAPLPTRLSLPLFQVGDSDTGGPSSVLAYIGQSLSRPSSRASGASDVDGSAGPPRRRSGAGVLYLPAVFYPSSLSASSGSIAGGASPIGSTPSSPAPWAPGAGGGGGGAGGGRTGWLSYLPFFRPSSSSSSSPPLSAVPRSRRATTTHHAAPIALRVRARPFRDRDAGETSDGTDDPELAATNSNLSDEDATAIASSSSSSSVAAAALAKANLIAGSASAPLSASPWRGLRAVPGWAKAGWVAPSPSPPPPPYSSVTDSDAPAAVVEDIEAAGPVSDADGREDGETDVGFGSRRRRQHRGDHPRPYPSPSRTASRNGSGNGSAENQVDRLLEEMEPEVGE